MFKRILCCAMGIFAAFTAAASANGLSYRVVDYGTGEICVTGSIDEEIKSPLASLAVFAPGVSAADIPAGFGGSDWQKYIAFSMPLSIDKRDYSVNFCLNPLEGEQPYTLSVYANGKKDNMPVYIYSDAAIAEFIGSLNTLDENSPDDELDAAARAAVRYFSLNNSEVYQSLYDDITDKAQIMKIFLADSQKPIKPAETGSAYAGIITGLERAAVTAAYNSGLASKLCKEDIVYGGLLGLDAEKYAYSLVKDAKPEGKKRITELMCGNAFANTAGLMEKFKAESVFIGVTYAAEFGQGTVSRIINNADAQAILSAQGWDKKLYDNSDKNAVAGKLYANPAKSTAEMITALNGYAKENPYKPGGSGGTGGGSSSSGGKAPVSGGSPVVSGGTQNVTKTAVFSDIPSGHWAEKSIMALYANGTVSGMTENTFAPNDYVTREQFLKMLVHAMGYTLVTEQSAFEDADSDAWYYPYVCTAVKNGIASGISETEFGVGGYITREQIAAMCYRAMKLPAADAGVIEEFADQGDIAEYAGEAALRMRGMGIISGNENGEFLPKNFATRAEAAQIIFGVINTR